MNAIQKVRFLTVLWPRGGIKWLRDDEFTDTRAAGAVNGTPCTPGPGTRTVVDTDSKLSISSGVLNLAAPSTPVVGDPGIWWDAQIRQAGRMLLSKIVSQSNTVLTILGLGWDDDQSGNTSIAKIVLGASIFKNVGSTAIGSFTGSTTYRLVLILRATGAYYFVKGGALTTWTLLWSDAADSTVTLYPMISTYNADFTCDFVRIPDALWLPTPLGYDSFTRANGALGTSEIVGPDGQAVAARAWTTIGGDFDIAGNLVIGGDAQANQIDTPGMESWSGGDVDDWLMVRCDSIDEAVDVYAGSHSVEVERDADGANGYLWQECNVVSGRLYYVAAAAKNIDGDSVRIYVYDFGAASSMYSSGAVTPVAWTLYQGVYAAPANSTARLYLLVNSAVAGTSGLFDAGIFRECHAEYIDPGQADVVFRADLTTPAAGTDPAGLIVRRDGATQWLVQVTPGTAGNDLELIELNNGVPTTRGTADVDPAINTAYVVTVITYGQTIDVFFDNAREIHYTAAAVGETNTQFGIWDSVEDNFSFDDVLIFPRGTDDEYKKLDTWSR